MDILKKILSSLYCILYIGIILLLPTIGTMFCIKFGLTWINSLFVFASYVLIEFYGKYYFKFNKEEYKNSTTLKIHHDIENNYVWIESNDTIDSVIDIDIVKHGKLFDK
jgi:hypothetical protein